MMAALVSNLGYLELQGSSTIEQLPKSCLRLSRDKSPELPFVVPFGGSVPYTEPTHIPTPTKELRMEVQASAYSSMVYLLS